MNLKFQISILGGLIMERYRAIAIVAVLVGLTTFSWAEDRKTHCRRAVKENLLLHRAVPKLQRWAAYLRQADTKNGRDGWEWLAQNFCTMAKYSTLYYLSGREEYYEEDIEKHASKVVDNLQKLQDAYSTASEKLGSFCASLHDVTIADLRCNPNRHMDLKTIMDHLIYIKMTGGNLFRNQCLDYSPEDLYPNVTKDTALKFVGLMVQDLDVENFFAEVGAFEGNLYNGKVEGCQTKKQ